MIRHVKTYKGRSSDHARAKIEKCHDATNEDGVSSNTQRMCIEDKLRHMQSSREQCDTSIEDKLKDGLVGPWAIISEVGVSI